MAIELELLGWPEDGPTLRLDYREFSYAGKFVMSSTGKAVAREPGSYGSVDRDPPDPGDDSGDDDETDAEDGGSVDTGDAGDDGRADAQGIVAAVAFNEDRTDPATLWLRYVTVRADRRGEGIGPRLVSFVAAQARDRGYERVRIAVNNPYAYEALYRAGFEYTGRETGIAELVLERDLTGAGNRAERCAFGDPDPDRYRAGLSVFEERDRDADQRAFVAEKREAGPPERRAEGADGR